MKSERRLRITAVLVSGMLFCSLARAQNISDTIRAEGIIDQGRAMIAAQGAGAPAAAVYEQESRQLATQLELVSENEDVTTTIVEGDTLTISFKDRDRFVRAAYKVSDRGEIFFPLVGEIKLAGLTRRLARERVDTMMREYIRDPQVTIGVNTDGRIMIFGAVLSPGLFNMKNRMTVMEAIMSAGGFNRQTAELASVIVIRGSVEKPTILKLNLKKMINKGDRSDDISVKPGDFIYVPTALISSLEQFWDRANGLLYRWYGMGGNQPLDNGSWNWGGK